jgi:HK97 family phage prohead protease
MPYFISDKHPDCSGWGLLKEDGELIFCHPNKEAATNHMIAISLAENIEPAGEYQGESFRSLELRDLPDAYRPANSDDVPEGRACGNCIFYREDNKNEEGLSFCSRWDEYVRGDYYCNAWEANEGYRDTDLSAKEIRQVDLSPPTYMRAAARRGVELYEEGRAGDGVTEQTIREARAMANGNVTADKYQRISAWIARHLPDLDAPQNQPGNDGFPGPGAVAFLLWGATPTPRGASRTQAYAEGITTRIEQENEGRAKGKALGKLELRTNPSEFEIRDEGEQGMRFTGYAAVFNSASQPLPFTERIAPGAFKRTLQDRNDIKLLWNHDTGVVLGSTRAGTLKLTEDSIGLRVEALLPPTTAGKDLAISLRRGDVDAMSFGFTVPTGGDSWSADGQERTLNSVRLHECSIVPFPAYEATAGTASVRGLDKIAKRAEVDADALADALLKLETGEDITPDDLSLLDSVIKALAPQEPEPEPQPEDNGKALLELKKMKLAALMKAI